MSDLDLGTGAASGPEFSIKVTNTLSDVYWANVYLPLVSPFNVMLLFLYGVMTYNLTWPWLQEGRPMLLSIVAAGEAIVIIAILHVIPLLVPVYGKLFNRLQGVVGEHEFAFEGDLFVEKTAFN